LESASSDFQDVDATSFAAALAAFDYCPFIELHITFCAELTEVGFQEVSGTLLNKVVLEPRFRKYDDDHMPFPFAFAVGTAFRNATR
jgi:hypothetical protein